MSRPPKPGQLVNRILDAAAHARLRALRAKLDAYEAAGWQPATYASVDGLTPLHLAAKHGYERMVRVLLAAGAATAMVNKAEKRPWDLASLDMKSAVPELNPAAAAAGAAAPLRAKPAIALLRPLP